MQEKETLFKNLVGWVVFALFFALSIGVSLTVGMFFGAKFGLLSFTLFIAYMLFVAINVFNKAGK